MRKFIQNDKKLNAKHSGYKISILVVLILLILMFILFLINFPRNNRNNQFPSCTSLDC